MYTQTIKLNMIPSGVPPVVHVNQYETQLNAFTFNLYKGTSVFTIPNNAAVLMNGVKPDGNVFSFAASRWSGNAAVFNCEQQMVPLAGPVVCELRLRTATEIVGTCNFILQVEEAPLNDDSVISETMIPLIEQAVDIAANLAEYIETTLTASRTAVDAAEAATLAAGEASVYNSNVGQMYNSLETVKQNANAAAARASAAAAKLEDISAIATTLSPGASATASYDSDTGLMIFGIPRGAKGDPGENGISVSAIGMFSMSVDANGDLWCYSDDTSDIGDAFEYDPETGELNYIFEDAS